ncbi:MAG: hypothetical protein II063_10300 [Prevotella sp.]|nr:hypothetical protein [Prevotella sp.]MBQ1799766.1 hypothetical protein [Prevotella sp.]
MKKKLLLFIISISPFLNITAQEQKKVTLSGSIQSDMLVPEEDKETGAEKTEDFLTNTYADLQLQSEYVDAGARLEYMEHPMPGFEKDFKGWGVPNFWVKGKLGNNELTLGTFYEQFGSGFILRTYEERTLGIDNSLLGGRLLLKPTDGVILKVLSGKQRRYWKWNKALVSGADAEISIDQWIPSMRESGTVLTLGASWVNKYEKNEEKVFVDNTHYVHFPKFVNSWDVRANFNHGPWNFLAEYAQKTADPSFANGYIFKKGSAAMLSGSYSNKGLSVLVQAKRSENMSSKSADVTGNSSAINYLPAFIQDHTYALAALYAYATQLADGEWAYQTEIGYNFKRNTSLGGKYGMNVKLNYSYVRGIPHEFADGMERQTLSGVTYVDYKSPFFKWGKETYYQDLNVQVSRRLSHDFLLNLMYMSQRFNKTVVEGEGGMVHSNIFIADGKYQFSKKTTLRCELQYLTTKQDEKDWVFGLLELSLVPHWMITVSDMWNCGDSKIHYYQGLVTYNVGSHRIQAGYERTQAGFNCSGGVCRYVPAMKGFFASYNYNF